MCVANHLLRNLFHVLLYRYVQTWIMLVLCAFLGGEGYEYLGSCLQGEANVPPLLLIDMCMTEPEEQHANRRSAWW